jgi:hypothetical protein
VRIYMRQTPPHRFSIGASSGGRWPQQGLALGLALGLIIIIIIIITISSSSNSSSSGGTPRRPDLALAAAGGGGGTSHEEGGRPALAGWGAAAVAPREGGAISPRKRS